MENENTEQQQQTLTFEFTVEQANLILGALSEAPYRVSAGVIQSIQQQAQGQMTTPMPVPTGETEETTDAEANNG